MPIHELGTDVTPPQPTPFRPVFFPSIFALDLKKNLFWFFFFWKREVRRSEFLISTLDFDKVLGILKKESERMN